MMLLLMNHFNSSHGIQNKAFFMPCVFKVHKQYKKSVILCLCNTDGCV